jgi:hypothetical protein
MVIMDTKDMKKATNQSQNHRCLGMRVLELTKEASQRTMFHRSMKMKGL